MMVTNASDDHEHMTMVAREALTRPDDSAWFDDRAFTTHGLVMSWADRGDDIVAESNFHTALDMLNAAVAHDETGASEARGDDVFDGSASHWAWGSQRMIFVRVYDEHGDFTPAFRVAVDIAWTLAHGDGSGILDEHDHNAREYAAWETEVDDAVDYAARGYVDSEAERALFYWLLTSHPEYREGLWDTVGFPSVDYDAMAKLYQAVRNDHFEWLIAPYPDPRTVAWLPLAGQEPLPGL
jgi:hypothetical protein